MGEQKKVLVAMSGGVDSSACAYLLLQQGYECMGVTMKLIGNDLPTVGEEEKEGKTCCSLEDVEDARSVAAKLGIPFYVFNFTDDFEEKVVRPFVEDYQQGRTPNPCIACNRHLKFGHLIRRAKELGYSYVATGHYARIEYHEDTGRYCLRKAIDPTKDQSYVLYNLTQEDLSHILFPLGEYHKDETRAIAEREEMVNARKHDSQDICFIPDGDYVGFLERYLGNDQAKGLIPGEFVDRDGNVIGTHKGICHYTIGQRKGLGIPGQHPYYVCAIDPEKNRIVLGDNEDLFDRRLTAGAFNWIMEEPQEGQEIRCLAKVRYRHKEAPASVRRLSDGRVEVLFDEPQRAITKGQAVVLYDGDYVLGGGTII